MSGYGMSREDFELAQQITAVQGAYFACDRCEHPVWDAKEHLQFDGSWTCEKAPKMPKLGTKAALRYAAEHRDDR